MRKCIIAVAALFALIGCAHIQNFHGTGSAVVPMSITASGITYHGLYVVNYEDSRIVNASGIVLFEKQALSCSVESVPGGGTVVEIDGKVGRWPGRPLLLITEPHNQIEIVSADIPLNSFESKSKLNKLIKEILGKKADRDRNAP